MGPLWYTCLNWDSILGPNHLSLLEFETWQIRPLSHHNRLLTMDVRGLTRTSDPSTRLSWLKPSMPALFFFFIFLKAFATLLWLTCFSSNFNFLSLNFIFSFPSGSSISWGSIPVFNFSILSTKNELNVFAISCLSVMTPFSSFSFQIASCLGFVTSF